MSETPEKGGYITQAWLVILLGLVYGAALAGVHTSLSGRIAENIRNATYSVIPLLVEGADKEHVEEIMVTGQDGKEIRVYKANDANGFHRGWVVPATGLGFADRIDILVGTDANVTTITGMYVLGQKETPGLGNKIVEDEFRGRFKGKPAATALTVVKSTPQADNQVLAVTGATVSSESVVSILNAALANVRQAVAEKK